MRISLVCLASLVLGVCTSTTKESLQNNNNGLNEGEPLLIPQENRNGWVDPEDLKPMPQCIAQQDPSTWLGAMSQCTAKQCTRHFGIICTRHQWLIQLSCLSTEFSSGVISSYMPYCSRSILAKAQLYSWIHEITGRTWLVDVGDANDVQDLSPLSLAQGYASMAATRYAPACLTGSSSSQTMEPFQHAMASCSFTSTPRHTGRADRPWEYREDLHSVIALEFETPGYDLTNRRIESGEYFDKDCFCSTFKLDPKKESCSEPRELKWTQEQLWMNATCGHTPHSKNWTDSLKTIGYNYISPMDWKWPAVDLPKQMISLAPEFETEACEIDSSGYCHVEPAIDRSKFCQKISYHSCGASCQFFEARIKYVNWLHDLCGDVPDWHGLPGNWHRLAVPNTLDMLPWRWTVRPHDSSNRVDENHSDYIIPGECASDDHVVKNFVLIHVVIVVASFYSQGIAIRQIARAFPWLSYQSSWLVKGIQVAALQLLGNWANAVFVQQTNRYEHVPVIQLILLWCSMPRITWLLFLLLGLRPWNKVNFSAAKSFLLAEMILQALSAYPMLLTINYGREHNFYLRDLEDVKHSLLARIMYYGALMWLIIVAMTILWTVQIASRMNKMIDQEPEWVESRRKVSVIMKGLTKMFDSPHAWLGDELQQCWMGKGGDLGERSSLLHGGENIATYGALPVQSSSDSRKELASLYAVVSLGMLSLWVAQWLFWIGFIRLSSEEFCLPKLGLLTVVWTVSSLASITAAM
ncbi:unnamed protein product [Periconia digitata]|uniref:Uncharacterized protein n=1 Tax=Periconia digitata TaxID=1303443 RepID=A0A9W4URA9_9PLEO|nr:unnamed protein product [Periconia digitata]